MSGPLWWTPDEEYVDESCAAIDRAKQTKGALMFRVRCGACGPSRSDRIAARVFDTSEGALFLAEIPQPRSAVDVTAARKLTGKTAAYPTFGIAVLLERPSEPGMERPLRASCPARRHGPLLVDRPAVMAAVATYRRSGKAAPIRAMPAG